MYISKLISVGTTCTQYIANGSSDTNTTLTDATGGTLQKYFNAINDVLSSYGFTRETQMGTYIGQSKDYYESYSMGAGENYLTVKAYPWAIDSSSRSCSFYIGRTQSTPGAGDYDGYLTSSGGGTDIQVETTSYSDYDSNNNLLGTHYTAKVTLSGYINVISQDNFVLVWLSQTSSEKIASKNALGLLKLNGANYCLEDTASYARVANDTATLHLQGQMLSTSYLDDNTRILAMPVYAGTSTGYKTSVESMKVDNLIQTSPVLTRGERYTINGENYIAASTTLAYKY